jgi:hypothetical protein
MSPAGDMNDDLVGRVISHYRILERLGAGSWTGTR